MSSFCFAVILTHSIAAQDPDATPQLVVNADGVPGDRIVDLDISHDGRWLAVAGGKEVRLYSLEDGELWKTLHGYREGDGIGIGAIQKARFSPDSQFLVVGVTDNTDVGSTRVYNLADPQEISSLIVGHTGCTKGVAFSPGGKYLATWSCDGYTQVSKWDAETGRATKSLRIKSANTSYAADQLGVEYFGFPVDDRWLIHAYGGDTDNLGFVDAQSSSGVGTSSAWPSLLRRFLNGPNATWLFVPSSPDPWHPKVGDFRSDGGAAVVISGCAPRSTSYWVNVWPTLDRLTPARHSGHAFYVTATAVRPHLRRAASADALGRVHVWSLDDPGESLYVLRPANRSLYRVAWSEDGSRLYFSDKPHSPGEYQYNSFGTINHGFDLSSRTLHADVRFEPPASPTSEWNRELGDQLELRAANRQGETVLQAIGSGGGAPEVHWPEDGPYSFRFLPQDAPSHAAGSLVVGTKRGALYQCRIDRQRIVPVRQFLGHQNAVTSLDVSPDGKHLASASLDGTLRFWSLEPPRILGGVDFANDGNRVVALEPDSESNRVGLKIDDTIIRLGDGSFYEFRRHQLNGEARPGERLTIVWDEAESGRRRQGVFTLQSSRDMVRPVLTLFLSKDGEWILWDERGQYDSSPGGERFVGWHVNRQRFESALFYPVDRFRDSLYRPREMSRHLEEMGVQVPEALAGTVSVLVPNQQPTPADLSIQAEFEQRQPPQVRIVEPESTSSVESETIGLVVEARLPAELTLRDVEFAVNGRKQPRGYETLSQRSIGKLSVVRLAKTVALDAGRNRITVEAVHEHARSNEAGVFVERTISAPEPEPTEATPAKPKLLILAIGVSKYSDDSSGRFDLKFADKDAKDFVAAWKRQEGHLYGEVADRTITGKDATLKNIHAGMSWLAEQSAASPDNMAVVLLSGHGLFDGSNRWYFGTHYLDPAHLRDTAVPYLELTDWFSRDVKCRKMFFADTCHAGAVPGVKGVRPINEAANSPWHGFGEIYMLSCLPHEVSLERDDWQNGAFTKALVAGLSSDRAADDDDDISFMELAQFVIKEVRRLTDDKQNPTVYLPPTVSDPRIAVVPPDDDESAASGE